MVVCASPGSIPRTSQIYLLLLPRNWRVETMDRGITKLCAGGFSWLLHNEGNCGCRNGGASVSWQTVEDGWWFFATACVEICWRWILWQKGVGCVSSQADCLRLNPGARELSCSHQPALMGVCQMCLPYPPSGQIRLNVRAWAGREKNVLCSDWKEKYLQGQSWTAAVGINKL